MCLVSSVKSVDSMLICSVIGSIILLLGTIWEHDLELSTLIRCVALVYHSEMFVHHTVFLKYSRLSIAVVNVYFLPENGTILWEDLSCNHCQSVSRVSLAISTMVLPCERMSLVMKGSWQQKNNTSQKTWLIDINPNVLTRHCLNDGETTYCALRERLSMPY